MKKLIFLLLFSPLVSCLEKKSCGKIVQKYTDNGKYYFAMRAFGGGGVSGEGKPAGADVFGDAEVSKKTYESFDVDDDYCIE